MSKRVVALVVVTGLGAILMAGCTSAPAARVAEGGDVALPIDCAAVYASEDAVYPPLVQWPTADTTQVIASGLLLREAEVSTPAASPGPTDGSWHRTDYLCHPELPTPHCPVDLAKLDRITVVAYRGLFHVDPSGESAMEELMVFADRQSAARAFAGQRAHILDCGSSFGDGGIGYERTTSSVPVGDEAFLVRTVQTFSKGTRGQSTDFELYLRRGSAIARYQGPARAQVEADARAMVAKLCRYSGDCATG